MYRESKPSGANNTAVSNTTGQFDAVQNVFKHEIYYLRAIYNPANAKRSDPGNSIN